MKITVYTRSAYGVARLYVADPVVALAVSSLTGARTLEARHVSALSALGHTFAECADPSAKPAWLSPSNVAALRSL